MEQKLKDLYLSYSGHACTSICALPASGSSRKYYRLMDQEKSCIGVYHEDLRENRLFLDFTFHFLQRGLPVPQVYCVSKDEKMYLQRDLGSQMLLNVIESSRESTQLSEYIIQLYKKILHELIRFQLIGGEGLDYSRCLPRPIFDTRCMRWDLNYFKYCFLKLIGVGLDEELLENDFDVLIRQLGRVETDCFMFRDFQSRNIMVLNDDVYFIDYQGGRRGALHYDVASLLYDAIVKIPETQREELLDYYIQELSIHKKVNHKEFQTEYYHFVLIRLLQALGAFGLRGLYEKKQHFIDSIVPALQEVSRLLENQREILRYPEIERAIKNALNVVK